MQARLMTLLNLRAGEGRTVGLMLAHYFFMGAAMILTMSSSMALFFDAWDVTVIPYIYLGIAIIVSSTTSLFLKISERTSLAGFLVMSLAFILSGTVLLRIGLSLTNSKWLYLVLPIWSYTLQYLSVTAFWTLAGNIFDIRQGKRIFGLMNAGSWLAYIVIGPFAAAFVSLFGTRNLYFIAAICVLIAFLILLTILRANPRFSVAYRPTSGSQPRSISMRNLIRKEYILLIFGLIAIWHVAYFSLDNIFYDRVALQFPNVDEMAGFLGSFFAAAGVLGFITDVFLTGRIISRFGLRAGLLVTPTMTILCVAVLTINGGIENSLPAVLFWSAAIARFANEGIGFSLDQSSFAVINQTLEENERARVQATTEGIIRPLATGLTGMLLLVFNTWLKFDATQLAYIYLLIAGVWVAVAITLIRAYPLALKEALHKRRFGENGVAIMDLASYELIKKSLDSRHPDEVFYALGLLEQGKREWLLDASLYLLDSENAQICINAIHCIEKHGFIEAHPSLKYLLYLTEEPTVRQAAARALTAMKSKANESLLNSPDPSIQRGALIGLLHGRNSKPFQAALKQLEDLATSSQIQNQIDTAAIIAESGNPSLFSFLLPLLENPEPSVRIAALKAAGQIKNRSLWPRVIPMLGFPETRNAAFSALVAGGEAALPQIVEGINNDAFHRRIRIRLVRACAFIKSPAAISELKKLIAYPNVTLRTRVLAALTACNFAPESDFVPKIEEQIKKEFQRAVWLLSCINDLGDSGKVEILIRALQNDLAETRNRLFHLFGFLYNPILVNEARGVFARGDANRRAYAIEVMDSILPPEHKAAFIPLLEDFSEKDKLKKMPMTYPRHTLTKNIRIMSIFADMLALESPWVAAVTLEIAIQNGLISRDQLSESLLKTNLTMLTRRMEQIRSESTMLSTFERVVILKSIGLFSNTPDEALAELADILEEVELPQGKNIFEKGSVGDSLYIIARGRVSILDEERVLNEMGERTIFGELSFFDSAPRTATICAKEDTTLLRLNQAPFFDLMTDYVEVAMGTIQMLTRSLRERTNDVLELRRTLQH